jgi:hypothetical protein
LSTTNVRGLDAGGNSVVVVEIVVVVEVSPPDASVVTVVAVVEPSADAETEASGGRSLLDPDPMAVLVGFPLSPPQPATVITTPSTATGQLLTTQGCPTTHRGAVL